MDTFLEHVREFLPVTQTHHHLQAHHIAKLPQSSLTLADKYMGIMFTWK